MIVSLRQLADADRDTLLGLQVAPDQVGFVAENRASLETIDAEPTSVGRVIVVNQTAVGLIVYETLEADGRADEVSIYRVMIDARHQRQGIGSKALRLLIAELTQCNAGFTKVWISAVPENQAARDLYARLGFVEAGMDGDGEILASIDLR